MKPRVDDLIRNLTDPDEAVRRYAAEDLTELRDPAAVPALAAALGDPSAGVREVAVDALKAIGGAKTAVAILPALSSDDPACRNAACEALKNIGEAAIGPLVVAVMTGDRDVRLFALDLLALIGGPGAGEALSAAVRDPDPNVAASAAVALGQVGGVEAVPDLVAALASDPWVRCAAATSLGRIGGPDAAAALAGLLADPDETVGYAAALALGECGSLPSIVPLSTAVGHSNAAVAATALDAFDRVTERLTPDEAEGLRGRVELGPVLALLVVARHAVQLQALRVLLRVGGPDAAPALAAAVRRTAALLVLTQQAATAVGVQGGE